MVSIQRLSEYQLRPTPAALTEYFAALIDWCFVGKRLVR
jgi:hypothetical protein